MPSMTTWGKWGANRIAYMRKRRKKSQQWLATAAGCSLGTVKKMERGERELTPTWMRKFALPLDCAPEALMGDVNDSSTTIADYVSGEEFDQVKINEIELKGAVSEKSVGENILQEGGASRVRAIFGFTAIGFRDIYGAEPTSVRIIEVRGDEASPEMGPGQKVLIDTSDVTPSPPGIFIVWDGLGMVVRRIQFLAHSEPPTVRIAPINPIYLPYDRLLGQSFIQGRIVGLWRRY